MPFIDINNPELHEIRVKLKHTIERVLTEEDEKVSWFHFEEVTFGFLNPCFNVWCNVQDFPGCSDFKLLLSFHPVKGFVNDGQLARYTFTDDAKKELTEVIEGVMDKVNRQTVLERFMYKKIGEKP